MAQIVQTIIRLVDDIDGSKGDETIEFGWDGKDYVIDLSEANANVLRECILPYVDAARLRPKGSTRTKPRATLTHKSPGRAQRDRIREWGRANGFQVSNISKIPQAVLDAYSVRELKE